MYNNLLAMYLPIGRSFVTWVYGSMHLRFAAEQKPVAFEQKMSLLERNASGGDRRRMRDVIVFTIRIRSY
jgi:hypothetical protein